MEKYMTTDELMAFLQERNVAFTKGGLANLRSKRKIPFHKIGGKVRYIEEEVMRWIKNGNV